MSLEPCEEAGVLNRFTGDFTKLRLREVESFSQGHTDLPSQDTNQELCNPEVCVLGSSLPIGARWKGT